jgi:hypothetical protein
MIFAKGTAVAYKNVSGVVSFACDKSMSILISKGKHPSQDVCVVVHQSDFNKVVFIDGK